MIHAILGAGYDIIGKLDEVLVEFDRILGSRLKVHLNKKVSHSKQKDRHASLGEGELGLDGIKHNKPSGLKTKPFA